MALSTVQFTSLISKFVPCGLTIAQPHKLGRRVLPRFNSEITVRKGFVHQNKTLCETTHNTAEFAIGYTVTSSDLSTHVALRSYENGSGRVDAYGYSAFRE